MHLALNSLKLGKYHDLVVNTFGFGHKLVSEFPHYMWLGFLSRKISLIQTGQTDF